MRGLVGFVRGYSAFMRTGSRHVSPRRRRRRAWPPITAALLVVASLVAIVPSIATAAGSVSIGSFQQCANGAPGTIPATVCNGGWINGDLNKQNSQYAEEQVVPQRIVVTASAGKHSFEIGWEDRKGAAQSHAYDSLATWNYTETGAQPCQGLSSSDCAGSATTLAIPPDPTPVPPCSTPCTSDVTSAQQLPNQEFVMYGGTLDSTSAYSHSAPASTTTDDETTITVNYTVKTAGDVVFLFGGHLAGSTEPGGWGAGFGSANINGGPYHIDFLQADGTAAGNRSNNIQSSAILGPSAFKITKTATPNPVNAGGTVTYTITVTNTGGSPGSTTFTDANDSRVTQISAVTTNPPGGSCVPEKSTPTTLDCTTSSLAPGQSQTFTYTAVMPTSFSSGSGTGGCSPGQFPVPNTATLASGQQVTFTECVNASPAFTINKTASPTTANPGQLVTYTITVTNGGTASGSTSFTDTNDPNVTNVTFVSSSPTGGTCTATTGTNLNCTTSTINPGSSQVFTITANMPATFTGPPGGDGCGPTQFPVVDTVTLTGGGSSGATVCVNASPAFTINKTASPTTADPGQLVTYTITVTNGGTAPGSTSFTETNDPNVTNATFVGSSPRGGTCTAISGTENFNCTTSRIKPGGTQVFTITVNMPATFTGNPGGDGCGPSQFPVVDTVTLTGGGSSGATVCVKASPNLVISKKANPTSTTPGGTVTYTITVTNQGTAPGSTSFSDTSNPAPQSISAVTVSGGSGTCTESGTTINCSTGSLAPGQTETFTYTAVMPASFSGNPGSGGCGPNQFPVVNTVVPTTVTVSSTSTTVCVTATPNLTLTKTAAVTDSSGRPVSPPATTGDDIVYTLTYGNTGTADANNTVISDTIPAGTEFISCSGGCVPSGNPATSVTWNIGTVPAGAKGLTVTLTVQIVTVTSCTISNTADISSPNFTPPGGSAGGQLPATAAVPSTPGPNPAGANASGSAVGAFVNVLGLVTTTIPSPPTRSAQGGVGDSSASASLVNVSVPPTPPTVLSASLISTSNDAHVVGGPDAAATDQATAETAGLCVLPVAGICTVKADTVVANAEATATGTAASISSAGSTFVNLTVEGVAHVNVSPNTCIALPAALFGAGSFVGLFVQSPASGGGLPTTCPPSGRTGSAGLTTVNGKPAYAGDLTVTMVDVHVTSLIGVGPVDVAVSQATAHADFPPISPACSASPIQNVSGHAFIAAENTLPPIIPALVGYVSIPPSGGADAQNLATVSLLPSGVPPTPAVSAGAAVSQTIGSLNPASSTSDSEAQAAGVCIMPVAGAIGPPSPSTCTIYAALAKAVSSSVANASSATSADSDVANGDRFGPTEFLNLTIGGQGLSLPVTRNDTILPSGLPIAIILDEETCDNGQATNTGLCGGPGAVHSGLTVTAIHVILLGPLDGLPIGADIKVAQAHSDATFG